MTKKSRTQIDSLIGDTLVNVLRQLRAGYNDRPKDYPQSVILCGVRYLRDYRIHQSNGETLTGGSRFNISAKALRLASFSDGEIRELYQQHTGETGQRFEESVFDLLQPLTGGQPWLVNALANEVTQELPHLRDRSKSITELDIFKTKERLILRREVHLDQLMDKLKVDFRAMLGGFQQFYRESAGLLASDVVYKQAAPQLTL